MLGFPKIGGLLQLNTAQGAPINNPSTEHYIFCESSSLQAAQG
jgi:hypothetical protein